MSLEPDCACKTSRPTVLLVLQTEEPIQVVRLLDVPGLIMSHIVVHWKGIRQQRFEAERSTRKPMISFVREVGSLRRRELA